MEEGQFTIPSYEDDARRGTQLKKIQSSMNNYQSVKVEEYDDGDLQAQVDQASKSNKSSLRRSTNKHEDIDLSNDSFETDSEFSSDEIQIQ